MVGRHHFAPPIPLRRHRNIIRCLLTFKSCSDAVISIGPAAISAKCPLATLLLHMEDFLSPSMVSRLLLCSFSPSRILSTMPPEARLQQWRVGTSCTKEMSLHRRCCWSKDGMKNIHSIRLSDVFVLHFVLLEKDVPVYCE